MKTRPASHTYISDDCELTQQLHAVTRIMEDSQKLYLLVLIILYALMYTQGSVLTNQGKEFMIGFSAQHFQHATNGTNRIYLTSDTATTVRVRAPIISLDTNIQLLPGIPRHIDLPGKIRMKSETGMEKKGIHLTSTAKFSVYGMNLLSRSGDGFLGLPVSALGNDYVISTVIPVISANLLVVATKDSTILKIKLRITSGGKISFLNKQYVDGSIIYVRLNAFEAFQIDTNSMEDISGTRVTSDKPVSVFSGCDCAYVPVNKVTCDHLVEQIVPVRLLGTNFITMATANRTGGDLYHVIATQDDTVIKIDGKTVTTMASNQRFVLDSKYNENHVISTSKPSLVMQYAKSYSVDDSAFDPFMSTVPATSHYSNDYTVFIPMHLSNNSFSTFVSIVAKTTSIKSIVISQGNKTATFSSCSAVKGSLYSVCTKQIPQGIYRIFHQSIIEQFASVMYGTWQRESFGFPVGLRFELPGCKSHMTPGDGVDNDCDNSTDEELFNNIDDDGDGRVDEDLATTPPSLNVPDNITSLICNATSFDTSNIGQAIGMSHAECRKRGKSHITFKDVIDKTKCRHSQTRTWKIIDGCTNIRETNQYIFVRFSSKVTYQFPNDLTLSCRGKSELLPSETGKPTVLSNDCNMQVNVRYHDSMLYPCTFTERELKRDWIITDECGHVTKHQQTIRLVPLVSELSIQTRNFNVSLALSLSNETFSQSTVRNQVDEVFMQSSFADSYLGSSLLNYRSSYSKPIVTFVLKFQKTSSITLNDIKRSFYMAFVNRLDLVNMVNTTDDIVAQDFNECIVHGYSNCDSNALCVNLIGSFNCTCLPGFIGDGSRCSSPPRIAYLTPYKVAGIGENVTLRCVMRGLPKPKISWKTSQGRILDQDVGLRDVTRLDDGMKRVRVIKQHKDGSLYISDVKFSDGGLYTCMAKNKFGEIRGEANLTIKKDRIAQQASVILLDEEFSDDLINRDSSKFRSLEKKVVAKLSDIFKDIKGFQKIEIIQFVKGSVIAVFRVVVKGDELRDQSSSIKQIIGKALQDGISSGSIGGATTAKLRGRPPAPANLHSSDLRETSVRIIWDPPMMHSMYDVSAYSLQYKELSSTGHPWRTITVTSLAHTLTRLKPGSSYVVRAKSKNVFGTSEPSKVLEITTSKERTTTDWLVLILIPILLLIIAIFIIVCVVRVLKRKGKYNPTATEEIAMMRLQSTASSETSHSRRSWRPFRSKKFTLDHSDVNEGQYTGTPMNIKKMRQSSDTEERLLLEPGDQHLWQEIPREQITLGEVLGEGEFGKVYKGTVTDSSGYRLTCAVKSLKSTATETDLKDLLNELEIMASVGHHNNVISLIGVCASGGPLLAVVEYAMNGNLLNYLRRHRRMNYDNMTDYAIDISAADRLKFACEISKGMSHLARMKCVHRDLAARNVLLGESLVAKVSDFGLSRDIYTDNVYEKKTAGKLPARWMALESLELGMYSSQSDVWSFGVVLWEIETGGATPFASYSVPDMIELFKSGRRLGRPTDCNRHLYAMMLRCWNCNPDRRPTFDALTYELKELYQQETVYVNVGDNQVESNINEGQPSTIHEEC